MYGDPLFLQHPFERILSCLNFSEFDLYCLIFAERQQYEYRFCPQPLTPYHREVPYMRCKLAGKESNTAAELQDHGAHGVELSRSRQGGGELAH
eukprot:257162-Pleurochrysis_carterae.AAC.1